MARQTSAATPERFVQGFTYADYINQIKVNKARFDDFYNNFKVTPEETQALQELVQRAHHEAIATFFFAGLYRAIPTLFLGASGRTAIIRVGVAIIADFAMVCVFNIITASAAVRSTIIKTISVPIAGFILSGINDIVATSVRQRTIGFTATINARIVNRTKVEDFIAIDLPIATIGAHTAIDGIFDAVKIIATSCAVLAVGIAGGITSFCIGDFAIATIITKVGSAV